MELLEALHKMPIIAILSEISPNIVLSVTQALVNHGINCIAISLNSSLDSLISIELLAKNFGRQIIAGANAVMTKDQLQDITRAGGRMVVMQHCHPSLIQVSKELGLYCIPGFSTPTEALTAIAAGADALKLFPCPTPSIVKTLKTCLPPDIPLIAGNGMNTETIPLYHQAGANGFIIDQDFYQQGDTPETVAQKAKTIHAVMHSLR